MKATLEFNLPEDQYEFESAQKGSHYRLQIEELHTSVFRQHTKHGLSFIGIPDDPNIKFKLPPCEYSDRPALEIDGHIAQSIEGAVVDAIWEKVYAHFKDEEMFL